MQQADSFLFVNANLKELPAVDEHQTAIYSHMIASLKAEHIRLTSFALCERQSLESGVIADVYTAASYVKRAIAYLERNKS